MNPHQVSGLYTLGTTCGTQNAGNTVYIASYDAWGNMTTRTTGGIASTLSYDALDHLVHWDGHAGTSEDSLYDASGERVLRRAVKSNGKEIFTYPFGLMDIRYSSSGVQVLENDYYILAGRLIGEREAGVTVFLLTDELGSVITSISSAAGSAAVTSNQAYSPYGTQRYRKGAVPTDKGFTGQHLDDSGLNYDHARYYDPVIGRFLSADTVQGNGQGMDPYSYVGNNPETLSDPTGRMFAPPRGGDPSGGGGSAPPSRQTGPIQNYSNCTLALRYGYECGGSGAGLRAAPAENSAQLFRDCYYTPSCKNAVADYHLRVGVETLRDVANWALLAVDLIPDSVLAGEGDPEGLQQEEEAYQQLNEDSPGNRALSSTLACSFTAGTLVETKQGEQAIGKLQKGDVVLAYNAKARKMEWQPIVHVWIHSDDDLVDLTIATVGRLPEKQDGKAKGTNEIVHTNKKHPFFTMEKGFLPVARIKVGMHVLRADGQIGVITGWKLVPGVKMMYNLEVAQDHTFTVGVGKWIVHNCDVTEEELLNFSNSSDPGRRAEGDAGLAAYLYSKVVSFRKPFGPNGRDGQTDVETPGAIVEVYSGGPRLEGKTGQIESYLGVNVKNPTGKPLIVYAPNLNNRAVQQLRYIPGVFVAQNQDQLIEYMTLTDSWRSGG